MNVYAEFHARIAAILERFGKEGRLPAGLDPARFVVEPPRDPAMGDLACNAAMVFARDVKAQFANPRQFATELAYELAQEEDVDQAEVAGPGFLNIRLKPGVFAGILGAILREGGDFGRGAAGRIAAKKVNVEYVSANPTGPMHVGHGRGAVFGDSLASLMEFSGSQVTREYYINDAGAQVDVLARSAFLRYREALGESIIVPDGLYPGDYLVPVGAALAAKYGESLRDKPESEWIAPVRAFAIDAMMDMIRDDLAALNITH
jgi:arginyl-tRNA synthetase